MEVRTETFLRYQFYFVYAVAIRHLGIVTLAFFDLVLVFALDSALASVSLYVLI